MTDSIPKPLLRVRGQPLIERHVMALANAGIDRIVINLAWLGAQIRDYLGDGTRYGASIIYSDEQPRALETAGGIFRALPNLSPGPFAVVNGDIYTNFPFADLGVGKDQDALLVLVPNPPHHSGGDFGLEGGLALADAPRPGAPRYTFAGIATYRAAFFAQCTAGVFPLKPLLLRSITARRCAARLYAGLWQDVGSPERLQALNDGVE